MLKCLNYRSSIWTLLSIPALDIQVVILFLLAHRTPYSLCCGRIGTIHGSQIAFEDHKPIGILEGGWETDRYLKISLSMATG